jgi:hypothetical protein
MKSPREIMDDAEIADIKKQILDELNERKKIQREQGQLDSIEGRPPAVDDLAYIKGYEEAIVYSPHFSKTEGTKIMKSPREIMEVLEDGISRTLNKEGNFPDGNYEDGAIAALSWVLGSLDDNPFDNGREIQTTYIKKTNHL